jgi:hypothetical protein
MYMRVREQGGIKKIDKFIYSQQILPSALKYIFECTP